MNARRRFERRWLGLPPARSSLLESDAWMPTSDGVRLATRVLRPANASVRRGTVLIRTERPLGGSHPISPIEKLGRWLAEDGRTVVIQNCRGRGASEGDFHPFADEVADGGCALRWLAGESAFGEQGGRLESRPTRSTQGREAAAQRGEAERSVGPREGPQASAGAPVHGQGLVLLGLGYSAFTAWAALSAAGGPVAALVAGFGARDPYAWLYPSGALQLEAALALAARLDGRAGFEPTALDLERAARHRPLGECDRVALRELVAFRQWLEHPRRDAWWSERTPALPDRLPPALFVSGWYECAFSAAYADFEAAAQRAGQRDHPAPALLIGPWGAAPLPSFAGAHASLGFASLRGRFAALRERARETNPLAIVAKSVLAFVAHAVGARPVLEMPARVFVRGAGWRDLSQWPPETTTDRTLYLRGGGGANSLDGDGRLAPEPPDTDRADTFVADPADPVPSLGGAAVAGVAGPIDQRPVERRGDVLCFTSDPLTETLELAGRVVLTLHAGEAASVEDTSAKLVAVEPSGAARWLCEGIARAAPGASATALEIDLGAAGARLATGTRLRLEVAASSLPRFARAEEGADQSPRVRTIYHDGERPSALRFQALPAR